MTNLDLYWMSNKDWIEREGFGYKLKESAPAEAKESYARYLNQMESAEERNSI